MKPRDPEMHQPQKGNQENFGMKAHIEFDDGARLTHSLAIMVTSEHDLKQTGELLQSNENFIFSDSGYRGAEQRPELYDVKAEGFIAAIPSKLRELKKSWKK
ncbi:MAG: transposase [Candidatus Endonucleobacter bathymodioli]|uniref:Transposase n=1 Tax=Candidatus Endonucleibacter bathymodioli TaxID=539814 RepID=A0AA90NWA2_9GAMM|nr:transposase [Candidatus Endonucleobacter bathymodioli]